MGTSSGAGAVPHRLATASGPRPRPSPAPTVAHKGGGASGGSSDAKELAATRREVVRLQSELHAVQEVDDAEIGRLLDIIGKLKPQPHAWLTHGHLWAGVA